MKRFASILGAVVGLLLLSNAASASIFFEYNTPDVHWKTFETEHFIIHYYEDNGNASHANTTKYTARRAAKYAEVMFPKVCEQFDFFLKEKVHLVIRDQEDYSNGFAVYHSDYVTIWSQPLYYPLRGRIDWVPDVVTHEFSHIVSLKANESRGVGASLAGVPTGALLEDGRNNVAIGGEIPLFMGSEAPFWWTEGGAEFWTHYVGYNDWGSSRDALLRMSILDPDATLTIDQLANRFDKQGFDGERGYNHGYSIGLYLAEKYGQETYAKFAEASRKGGRFDWDSIIKDVLGLTPEEMWAGWVEWAKARYERMRDEIAKEGLHQGNEMMLTPPEWEKDPEAWAKKDKRYRKLTREKSGFYNMPFISADGKTWGTAGVFSSSAKFYNTDPDTYAAVGGSYVALTKEENDRLEELGKRGKSLTAEEAEEKKKLEDKKDEYKKQLDDIEDNGIPAHGCLVGSTGRPSVASDSSFYAISSVRAKGWAGDYELDGYEWHDIWVVDLAGIEQKGGKELTNTSCEKHVKRITKNFRAFEPAVSPDNQWIAFTRYSDGTYQVWKVKPDGSEATQLTHFTDGTLSGLPTWSPDGSQIAFYLYKPHQQDIWVINADGTGLHPVTWDAAEDKDPYWAADGTLYWSSDRTGIFNIYKMDLKTKDVTQVTNVVGGAHFPVLTPKGNLLYADFTAFGFKTDGLSKDNFYNKHIGNGVQTAMAGDGVAGDENAVAYELPSQEEADKFIAEEEDLPDITSPEHKLRKYNPFWNGLQPPMVVPLIVAEDFNVKAGGELIFWDSAGKHAFIADALLGRDREYVARYFNWMTYPELGLIYARFERTFDRGFKFEDTPGSGEFVTSDIKLRQRVDFYLLVANMVLGPRHDLNTSLNYRTFEVGISSNAAFDLGNPLTFGKKGFSNTYQASAQLNYHTINTNSFSNFMDVNPRGGREITVGWDLGWTKIPGFQGQGFDIDDGQKLSDYLFNTYRFAYAEYIKAPWLDYYDHTIQFTLQGGLVDRNVQFNDEMFAGGQHPYRAFGDINVNSQFAGYESFSLTGETMLIASLAYRLPIVRDVDKKFGPVYLDSVYFQAFGTVGNLWGFRPTPSNGQLNSAVDVGNIREMPFIGLFDKKQVRKQEQDYAGMAIPEFGPSAAYGTADPNFFQKMFPVAAKNGNRLLSDVGAEVRVRSFIHNYNTFYSFVRLAYGFNRVAGVSDVNNDRVIEDLPPADDLVTETEPPGFRFYFGIGTGF